MIRLLPLFLLSSCQIYAGMAVHDRAFDSEYQEDATIANIGLSQDVHENIELYIGHSSMPWFAEKDNGRGGGYGVNQAGVKVKYKLY